VFHKQYRATTEFITEADGEVGLGIGDVLDVIEETDSGWFTMNIILITNI
jgi:hypothetical protein